MPLNRRVLVVGDGDDQHQTLCRGLHYLGMVCIPVRSVAEVEVLLSGPAELLLADLTFPKTPAFGIVERVRALRPELPVLLLTGLMMPPDVQQLRAQHLPILRKPFGPHELGQAIEAALVAPPSRGPRGG